MPQLRYLTKKQLNFIISIVCNLKKVVSGQSTNHNKKQGQQFRNEVLI